VKHPDTGTEKIAYVLRLGFGMARNVFVGLLDCGPIVNAYALLPEYGTARHVVV